MWNRIRRWSFALASSVMFIVPAFTARADDQQNQNTGAPVKDDWITKQVKQRLSATVPGASHIDVDTKDDVVKLSGSTPTETSRAQAVQIARETEGVKQVKDEIKVNPGQ